MLASRVSAILLASLLATTAAAQATISSAPPPILGFIDISTVAGAVQVTPIYDDSVTTIPAGAITVGNSLFPAGAMSISNNGVVAGIANAGISFVNASLPSPTGLPPGISGGAGILMPFWDDLYPVGGPPPTQIWYLNDTANGVAHFMWKDENHYYSLNSGEGITFEAQVFQGPNCAQGVIQFLYSDTIFGGAMAANDNGASATVGYSEGTSSGAGNAQFSYNTPSLAGVTCLTITGIGNNNAFAMNVTSPFGTGSLQVDITGGPCGGGPYFMPVTLNAGNFPNGWLFGLDIGVAELGTELGAGYPFLALLNGYGAVTIGPIAGVPSGLTFYAAAMTVVSPGFPGTITPPMSYTVP